LNKFLPIPFTYLSQSILSIMTEQHNKMTEELCAHPPAKYDDLKVLFLNCTLNRTPVLSHTEGLINVAQKVYESVGVQSKIIRPVDYEIPAGLGLDMSKTPEWDRDDWPQIQAEIDVHDIVIICTSVWLGEKSPFATALWSACTDIPISLTKKASIAIMVKSVQRSSQEMKME